MAEDALIEHSGTVDRGFHAILIGACAIRRSTRCMVELMSAFAWCGWTMLPAVGHDGYAGDARHLVVLEALRTHDIAAAVAAMEDHLRRALHRAIGLLNRSHGAPSPMPKITKVEFTSFAYKLEGIAVDEGHNTVYKPGGVVNRTGLAVRIFDSDGIEGCFVYPSPELAMVAQAKSLAHLLIGRDPNAREKIYDDIKRIMRKLGAFGYSPLDIALWDMAGKRFGASITTLLGGFRESLPTYASTFHGDRNGGLSRRRRSLIMPNTATGAASVPSRSMAGL